MKINLHFYFLCFIIPFVASPVFSQNRRQNTLFQKQTFAEDKIIIKLKKHFSRAATLQKIVQDYAIKNIQSLFPPQSYLSGKTPAYLLAESQEVLDIQEVTLREGQALADVLQKLQDDPRLEYAEPVALYTPQGIPNDPLATPDKQWGLFKAKLPEAWDIHQGDSTMVIAIIDTGVKTDHPDLINKVAYNEKERLGLSNFDDDGNGYVDDVSGFDFTGENNGLVNAHGTWVAGVAAAQTNNGIGVAGTGFKTKFMSLKVYNTRLEAKSTDIFRAIKYAADNGCKIINVSLITQESGTYYQWEQDVINYAVRVKDALVVASAGNARFDGMIYPAAYDNVFSVTSTNLVDVFPAHAAASNYAIDVSAPGETIWTTNVSDTKLYEYADGTSMAAPFVAGIAALVRSKYPELSALQTAELLRISVDNIDHIPENAPFRERIGKGRINALRALQERHTAQVVRLQSHTYKNKFGNFAFANDSVTIEGVFANYLKPSTKNLRAEIVALSANVTVLNPSIAIGSLKSADSLRKNIKIYLKPDTKPNTILNFRIAFSDDGYTDYQYFTIKTSPYFLSLDKNQIQTSIAANGRIGYVSADRKEGLGFLWNNENLIKEISLVAAVNNTRVSSAITLNTARFSDFLPTNHARIGEEDLQYKSIVGTFTDTLDRHSEAVGVQITQKAWARKNTPHQRYIVVEYDVKNISNRHYDSLNIGLFADWDIGDKQNYAAWDNNGKFGYIYKDGSTYTGIKAINSSNSYYAFDKNRASGNIDISDGFSITEQYLALTGGVARQNAGTAGGSDVAHLVGAKIRDLGRGETETVVFVIAAAPSLSELADYFRQAEVLLNPNSSKSPKPTANPIICTDEMLIKPQKGKKFRFYEESNLAEPFLVSSQYQIEAKDTAKVWYISNVDSLVESDLLAYRFRLHTPKVSFIAPDSLNLFFASSVQFFDKSLNPRKWHWNFGDGSLEDSTKNPIHFFDKTGVFKVRLSVVDSAGCSSIFEKLITVVRLAQSPKPVAQSTVEGCKTGGITIRPSNGTRFKFYADLPLKKPIATGRDYVVIDINLKVIYITNIDSALESDPIAVNIVRNNLKAIFDYTPKADTIIYEKISFIDQSTGSKKIVAWQWNFGNGSPLSTTRNPSHIYNAQGIYKVRLVVTDLLGCTDTTYKSFRVGRKAPTPTVPAALATCKGGTLTLKPEGGTKFNFYADKQESNLLHTGARYDFVPIQSGNIFVTCADSIVESESRSVQITVNEAVANFKASISEVWLHQNQTIFFTDQSINAKRWLWDFGNGETSNSPNPSYLYTKQGEYTVTLHISDQNSCEGRISKKIKVLARSPKPIIISELIVCQGEDVTLAPQGGQRFNFYLKSQPQAVYYTGNRLIMSKVSKSVVFLITSIDSLIESEAVEVSLRIENPIADFVMNRQTINVAQKDSLQLTNLSSNAVRYEWDFGNGEHSSLANPKVFYQKKGVYEVVLSAFSLAGCRSEMQKAITVLDSVVFSGRNSLFIFPNPAQNQLQLQVEIYKPATVQVWIFNAVGNILSVYSAEALSENKNYHLNLQDAPRGAYFIKVQIDNEILVKKLLLN